MTRMPPLGADEKVAVAGAQALLAALPSLTHMLPMETEAHQVVGTIPHLSVSGKSMQGQSRNFVPLLLPALGFLLENPNTGSNMRQHHG